MWETNTRVTRCRQTRFGMNLTLNYLLYVQYSRCVVAFSHGYRRMYHHSHSFIAAAAGVVVEIVAKNACP